MLISEDADIDRARQEEAKHTGGFSPFAHGNMQAPFRGVRAAAGLPPAPMFKVGDVAPSRAAFESYKNVGHGHVLPRPDGVKTRCGGPNMCSVCAQELAEAVATGLVHLPESNLRRPDRDHARFEPTGSVLDDLVFVPAASVTSLTEAKHALQKVLRDVPTTAAQRQEIENLYNLLDKM